MAKENQKINNNCNLNWQQSFTKKDEQYPAMSEGLSKLSQSFHNLYKFRACLNFILFLSSSFQILMSLFQSKLS